MKNNKCIIILAVLLIITISRYISGYYGILSKGSLSTTLVTVLLATITYYYVRKETVNELKNNFFQISTIIVVGFILVHFIEYLAFVTGEHQSIIDIEYIDSSYVNGAAMVSCACLITYYIGAALAKRKFSFKEKKHSSNMFFLESFMLLSVFVFYISAGEDYFKGGYVEAMNVTGMSLFAQVSQTCIIGAAVACSVVVIYRNKPMGIKDYIKNFSFVYYIALFSYCLLVLTSGDRGPLIQCFLCYWIPYIYVGKRKVKVLLAVILLSFGALFLSLLGTVRSMEGSLSMEKMVEAQELRNERFADDNIIFASTAELSKVVRSYHVIYHFAETRFIVYGAGFANKILGIIPGLRYVLYPILGIDDAAISASRLSTLLLQKDHGMGCTCVADTYFNFGAYGTIIVFFFVGLLFRKMDISAYKDLRKMSPFVVCSIVCYMMFAIYIGRSSLFTPINILAYSWALFMVNDMIRKTNA